MTDAAPSGPAAVTTRRGLAFVLLAALTYALVHIGFRLLASGVLGEDDTKDIILVQDLKLAYDAFPRQPPLYDWVLWGVQQLTGPRIESFLLIKYTALIATVGFLYLAAVRVLNDRLWAMLSVESLALIYSIAWRYHEGFTHEVLAMVAVTATFWAMLRVCDFGRLADFILVGILAGLGALTEPNYTVFLVTLLVAAALQPATRRRIFRPALGLSAALALAIASPYLFWLAAEPERLAALMQPPANYWSDMAKGLWDAVRGPIVYLSPLVFIIPVMFPGVLRVALSDLRAPINASAEPDLAQLVLHMALCAFTLAVFGAVAFAISGNAIHVQMPLYVVTSIWLFSCAQRATHDPIRISRFTRLALALAIFALVLRLANMFVLQPVCNKCRWGIPYAGLAAEMRASGFDGTGTIVALHDETAGNLRRFFPTTPVISRGFPNFTPRSADLTRGKVAYVWNAKYSPKRAWRAFKDVLIPGVGRSQLGRATTLTVPWRHTWRPEGYHHTKWRVLVVEPES